MKMLIAMLAVVVAGQVASAVELEGANPPVSEILVTPGACTPIEGLVKVKVKCVDLSNNEIKGAKTFKVTENGIEKECCPLAQPRQE